MSGNSAFLRKYDFSGELDELWSISPGEGWGFDYAPGNAHFYNTAEAGAMVFLRPCAIYGDSIELEFKDDQARKGIFEFCYSGTNEYISLRISFEEKVLEVITHEAHKPTPRLKTEIRTDFSRLTFVREEGPMDGLPYEGSIAIVLADDVEVGRVEQIDFQPECCLGLGLPEKGEVTFSSVTLSGQARPRREYLDVGVWQQSRKGSTKASVDALIIGVETAAEAEVDILITPETSLTSLRPNSPELSDYDGIQTELKRFQQAIERIDHAPYTLIGYPEWIDGSEVDGATLDKVKVNCHRFVRPDGSLGPMMAKVHSCEVGLWHGRHYNLQRVCGVEVALGVCYDGGWQDVWATGVMGGARLCLHPLGGSAMSGNIPEITRAYEKKSGSFGAFWVFVNSGGGAGIIGPELRNNESCVLALPRDLTEESPSYP